MLTFFKICQITPRSSLKKIDQEITRTVAGIYFDFERLRDFPQKIRRKGTNLFECDQLPPEADVGSNHGSFRLHQVVGISEGAASVFREICQHDRCGSRHSSHTMNQHFASVGNQSLDLKL